MTTTSPFTAEAHAVGTLADGRVLELKPMTPEAAACLAPEIAGIGPWAHYNFAVTDLQASMLITDDGAIRYQLVCDGAAAGVVIIRSPWLAGPYLQLLAVLPMLQGSGAGSAILKWYETTAMTARMRNVWLCVSGFNVDAQRFYERYGYSVAGRLPDLMRDGDDELLMRKSLAGLVFDATPFSSSND